MKCCHMTYTVWQKSIRERVTFPYIVRDAPDLKFWAKDEHNQIVPCESGFESKFF